MKKYIDVLKKCPLFENISEENIIALLSCLGAKVETFGKKYTIFAEGSRTKYFGIILTGSAHVVQIDYYGNRRILAEIMPSEIFAESFACAELNSIPVSVISSESCEVLLIDSHRILQSCSNVCGFHQQIIFNLMKDIAMKNIMFYQKTEITSKRTTREKLLTYLMFQAKKSGSRIFEIPFNRQELADYLEVDRSGLSAEISKLRNEGILESQKSTFKLL